MVIRTPPPKENERGKFTRSNKTINFKLAKTTFNRKSFRPVGGGGGGGNRNWGGEQFPAKGGGSRGPAVRGGVFDRGTNNRVIEVGDWNKCL